MLLGQNWNSGRVGEGVKTEDWEALKQNTIVIVLFFISIATLMQCFSLTPGIPLLWSPPGLSLETSTGTGTGRVPVWLWTVGKWMRFEEISSNPLMQLYGLPLRCGTDQIRRFSPRTERVLLKWWWQQTAIILWGASHWGSVRMRGQCYFYRSPLRVTLLPLDVLSLKFGFRSSEGLSKSQSKKLDILHYFFWIQITNSVRLWLMQTEYLKICRHLYIS